MPYVRMSDQNCIDWLAAARLRAGQTMKEIELRLDRRSRLEKNELTLLAIMDRKACGIAESTTSSCLPATNLLATDMWQTTILDHAEHDRLVTRRRYFRNDGARSEQARENQ